MAQLPHVFDASADNFQALVLDNSDKGPVVVNYWAPWAGPCLKLWDVLEKLAADYNGRFLLVNVNTDTQKQLARGNGVNSVPTLKIYRHRRIVEEVHGAESETALRARIDRHVAQPADAVLADAVRALQQGQTDAGVAQLRRALAADPTNPRTVVAGAKLYLRNGLPADAEQALRGLPTAEQQSAEVSALLGHCGFMQAAAEAPSRDELLQQVESQPDDLAARYRLAAVSLPEDDFETALAQLLEILRRDRDFRDGAARAGVNALFQLLGRDHPLTRRYRSEVLDALG